MVLRLKRRGLLVGGPPCNSWIFINAATHGRRKDNIFGNTNRKYVSDATAITCRFILLGLVAIARDAFFLGEQPSSSLMTDFPYMLFMASVVAPLYWSKVSFPMGAYGHPNTKPTKMFGTLPYMQRFKRKLSAADKRRINKNKAIKKFQTVRKTINKTTGKTQV
ncbi:WD_REPEATS_REGION domain-containing protein [Durusdinium trenchii]|uniref:WD_REPEATS_REGION domain-containing protein n=1 Tax=Durusdinium trenchii TaxID=1381693 RepID=A0ABP0RVW3_9DINO